jgi:S1-C subfamily serine protease
VEDSPGTSWLFYGKMLRGMTYCDSEKRNLLVILISGVITLALLGCSIRPGENSEQAGALRLQVQSLEARIRALENKQERVSVAVAKARGAVAFVWGTYTFADGAGRPLRHVLDEAGKPISNAKGVPLVDVNGTGAVVLTNYSGTAFLVDDKGHLLTNRHVAEPWWEGDGSAVLRAAGLRPVFIRLKVFFPERSLSVPIEVIRVDAELDVALARTVGWIPDVEPLSVHSDSKRVREGQPVFVVGYPTGLDAVLARLETKEQAELEKAAANDSYAKARLLSQRQQIRPSITGGFLWEVLPNTLVYDAHTTGGASGGPVLDSQGRVIGINTAYLSSFRGINYGVPIKVGQDLLRGRGRKVEGPTRETPNIIKEFRVNQSPLATSSRSAVQSRELLATANR